MAYINTASVSRYPIEPDEIQISFNKDCFTDPLTEIEINSGETVIIELPRQIEAAKVDQNLDWMRTAFTAAISVTAITVVLKILLGVSLKLLWVMVNTIQFVVFFTDWPV